MSLPSKAALSGLELLAPKVDVVDTIGAGAAFNAGYLGALLSGAAIETALREGVDVASAAIASSPRQYRAPDKSCRQAAARRKSEEGTQR